MKTGVTKNEGYLYSAGRAMADLDNRNGERKSSHGSTMRTMASPVGYDFKNRDRTTHIMSTTVRVNTHTDRFSQFKKRSEKKFDGHDCLQSCWDR